MLNKRLALAFVLGLVMIGGSDGDIVRGSIDSPDFQRPLRDLPYGGLAALAEAAPSPTPRHRVALQRVLGDGLGARLDSSGGGERYSGDIAALISAYPWSAVEATRIMMCESRGDPGAYNPSGARGLFQIMPVHRARVGGDIDALYDPATNVRVAWDVYVDAGYSWQPWAACS